MKVEDVPLKKLKADPKNARKHSEANIAAIEGSLRAFGQQKNIVALKDGTVIAGNGTLVAATRLGWKSLAVVRFADEKKARAFALADNRSAELAAWDEETLNATLDELKLEKFDLGSIGFDMSALGREEFKTEEQAPEYSQKMDTPLYTPKGEKPELKDLVAERKAAELVQKIKGSKVSEAEKTFLLKAATRHVVFDYQAIAEYYCHASREMQELMESSALVIIDFKKAVEEGYVVLSHELSSIYAASHGDGDEA